MAVEVTCYVDPDASGAANGTSWTDAYVSLNSAEAAIFNATSVDLVSEDEWVNCLCRSSSGSADSSGDILIIDGFITDSTRYIDISGAVGERHSGIWSNSIYRLTSSANTVIMIQDDYTRFKWLQIENTRTGATQLAQGFQCTQAAYDNPMVENCIIKGNNPATSVSGFGIYFSDNGIVNPVIVNTIIYNFYGGVSIRSSAGLDAGIIYNVTVANCGTVGLSFGGGDGIVKNSLVFNCTTAYNNMGGGDQSNSTNNAGDASAADIIGGNSVDLTAYAGTDIFADYSGEDFHLSIAGAGAAQLKGAGADLSGDSFYAVILDIDDELRHIPTPDIGADEYYAEGGVSYPALLLINGQFKRFVDESPNYPFCINTDGSQQTYADLTGKDPLVLDNGDLRKLDAGETLDR